MYNLGAFAPFRWATREKILILTYHRFSLEENPQKISSAEFAAHLEYLSKNNRVLSLQETIDYLKNGKTLPPNTTVITIDDGYADAFEIAFPLLKKYEFPATVYAVTDFLDEKCWLWTDLMRYVLLKTESDSVEIQLNCKDKIETELKGDAQRLETASRINSHLKKLPDEQKEAKIKAIAADLNVEIPTLPIKEFAPVSWAQAREMDAENVKIESHTAAHPILTNVSAKRLDFELKTSKKRLEEVLDRQVEHFCYPNGSFDENVWKAVENSNYKSATTTNYGFNEKNTNRFLLNRIDAQSGAANFAQSASGFEATRQGIMNLTQRRESARAQRKKI
jgi:peptidoglycan/xylan/chitin deacetylase (PgdA/CDA1 family)